MRTVYSTITLSNQTTLILLPQNNNNKNNDNRYVVVCNYCMCKTFLSCRQLSTFSARKTICVCVCCIAARNYFNFIVIVLFVLKTFVIFIHSFIHLFTCLAVSIGGLFSRCCNVDMLCCSVLL